MFLSQTLYNRLSILLYRQSFAVTGNSSNQTAYIPPRKSNSCFGKGDDLALLYVYQVFEYSEVCCMKFIDGIERYPDNSDTKNWLAFWCQKVAEKYKQEQLASFRNPIISQYPKLSVVTF